MKNFKDIAIITSLIFLGACESQTTITGTAKKAALSQQATAHSDGVYFENNIADFPNNKVVYATVSRDANQSLTGISLLDSSGATSPLPSDYTESNAVVAEAGGLIVANYVKTDGSTASVVVSNASDHNAFTFENGAIAYIDVSSVGQNSDGKAEFSAILYDGSKADFTASVDSSGDLQILQQ